MNASRWKYADVTQRMGERSRLAFAVIGAISVLLVAVGAVFFAQAVMHSSAGMGMMSNMMGNPSSMQAQCQAMMGQTDMSQCPAMMSSSEMSQCMNMMGSHDMTQCQAMMQQQNMTEMCR